MTIGDGALEWMLRRLNQAVSLGQGHDLVLVRDHPAIADVGPSVEVLAHPWRVARVTGELTLRDALPEADRLIAVVPPSFPAPPMDIAARAYLHRVLELRAEDLVAAASGRPCETLVDERVAQAVFDSLETLRATAGHWSLGDLVTTREVRAVLVGAELGATRLDRERDWELLARWIVHGAPSFRAVTLVEAALLEAQPRSGAWLAWALTEGSLEQLCTAGALLASVAGQAKPPSVPGAGSPDQRAQLVELVDSALREVWRTSPERAKEMLATAERAARQVDLDASSHRLLRVPLEGSLNRFANAAAEGLPPEDAEVEGLKRNLHAPELVTSIDAVADLARLARFQRLDAPSASAAPVTWFAHALRDVAWADLAYRRLRRAFGSLPAWLADPAGRLLGDWTRRRDTLNAAFAESLAREWPAITASSDARQPLALHQLTRCVLRRLVDDGARVFLVVLDGCDLASFLEVVESLPVGARLGLVVPEVQNAILRDDLAAMGALGVAIAPVPTVTSHARRALFAGEISGNTALDDTESAAANAAADQQAWTRNGALGQVPRKLFLKGDLGAQGEPLIAALRARDAKIVAAVFNAIDDSLSSKETTAPPTWSLSALGAGAAEAIGVAVEEGWCVVVTADHGHTPYVAPDRKVAGASLGHRFSGEASEAAVAFSTGPLPRKPLYLLARYGGWFGHQRRGFHGGAGIEEVVVPLAFLGRVRGEQEGRARAPAWWWSSDAAAPAARAPRPQAPARPPAPESPPSPAPVLELDPRLASLGDEERRAVALLQRNQSARLSEIARHLKKSPMRASGFMQQLIRKLFELGYPCVTVDVLPDSDRLYRYEPTGGGSS